MRGRALIGVTFTALLLVLVGDNVYRFGLLQRRESCDFTICLRPRSLESNALANRHVVVNGQYPLYYHLAERISGATVTIPPWMQDHRPKLRRMAHVTVATSPGPMLLDPDKLRDLRKRATRHFVWLHERDGPKKVRHELHVVLDPEADHYVIAETGEPGGDLYFLPAPLYAEVARP